MTSPIEILCKGLPYELSLYMIYVKALRFEDKPDYNYLKRLFKELFFNMNYELDYMYDWTTLAIEQGKEVIYDNGKVSIQIINSMGGIGASCIGNNHYDII